MHEELAVIPCPACGYNVRGLPIGASCPECGLLLVPPRAREPRGRRVTPRFRPSEMVGIEVHPAVRRLRNAPDIPMLVIGAVLPPLGIAFSIYLFVVASDGARVLKHQGVPRQHPDHRRVRSARLCGVGVLVVPVLFMVWTTVLR